ncbi:MAG: hypothetical protein WCP31_12185 [Chloroflexales bacterium]
MPVGSNLELGPTSDTPDLPDQRLLLGTSAVRRIRLFRLGRLWRLVTALTTQTLPLPTRLVPEPWPKLCEHVLPDRKPFLMSQCKNLPPKGMGDWVERI